MMRILFALWVLVFSASSMAASFDDDIKEMLELTGGRSSYGGLNNLIISQMQSAFFQAVDESIDVTSFNEGQRQQAGEVLKSRFTKMVENYEAFVKIAMPYNRVVEEVYIPLYKEIFTHDEIKQLLAFYKSPIGKKTIESTTKIAQETAQRPAEKYNKVITEYLEKQIEKNVPIVNGEIEAQLSGN